MITAPDPDVIVGWVVDLMDALGAPGVGLAIALENVFLPLPSEVFLPLAGFAAARGEMSVVAAIAWTTLGSLVGALVLYGIGAALGRNRLRALVDRMPLVHLRDVDRAEAWFARHGAKAVLIGRMVPLVRSLISVPAGVERMPLGLFAALTATGSLVWNTAFVLAGYALGENWHVVERYADIASKAVLVVLVLSVVAFVGAADVGERRGETRRVDLRQAGHPGDGRVQQAGAGRAALPGLLSGPVTPDRRPVRAPRCAFPIPATGRPSAAPPAAAIATATPGATAGGRPRARWCRAGWRALRRRPWPSPRAAARRAGRRSPATA